MSAMESTTCLIADHEATVEPAGSPEEGRRAARWFRCECGWYEVPSTYVEKVRGLLPGSKRLLVSRVQEHSRAHPSGPPFVIDDWQIQNARLEGGK